MTKSVHRIRRHYTLFINVIKDNNIDNNLIKLLLYFIQQYQHKTFPECIMENTPGRFFWSVCDALHGSGLDNART